MKVIIQRPIKLNNNTRFANDLYEVKLQKEALFEGDPFYQLEERTLLKENVIYDPTLPILHHGYVDTHLHAMWMAQIKKQIDLRKVTNKEELLKTVNNFIDEQGGDDLILGSGWSESRMNCSAKELELYFRENIKNTAPVLLWRTCFHSALINRNLSERLESLPDKSILVDEELFNIYPRLPAVDADICKESFVELQNEFIKKGFRGLCDMSLDPEKINAYLDLLKNEKVLLDICGVAQYESCRDTLHQTINLPNFERFYFSIQHMKLFLDGSLGASTAWLSQPYCDSEEQGVGTQLFTDEELVDFAYDAISRGFYLSFHCIGDATLDQVLKLGRTLGLKKEQCHYHRLEHVQVCREDQLEELKEQGWRLYLQPVHRPDDLLFVEKRLGAKRLNENGYRMKSYIDLEIPCAFGSDAPISSFNVEENIQRSMEVYPEHENLSYDQHIWFYSEGAYMLLFDRLRNFKIGDRVYLSQK